MTKIYGDNEKYKYYSCVYAYSTADFFTQMT